MKQDIDSYVAYRRMADRILRDIEQQDQEAIRRVIQLLHEARMSIIKKLTMAEGWDIYNPTLSGMLIEKWLPYFEGRYQLKSSMRQWDVMNGMPF